MEFRKRAHSVAVDIWGAHKSEDAFVPAVSDSHFQQVLPALQLPCHVVGLVLETAAVAGPPRRHPVLSGFHAVYGKFIDALCRRVETRFLHIAFQYDILIENRAYRLFLFKIMSNHLCPECLRVEDSCLESRLRAVRPPVIVPYGHFHIVKCLVAQRFALVRDEHGIPALPHAGVPHSFSIACHFDPVNTLDCVLFVCPHFP